ncbi:MAG: TlyA family RNA methyltransferase [Mariprofundaceae bacterium]
MATKKTRLDRLLSERGLAESGEKAKRLIMAGLVYVNGQKSDKPGTRVAQGANIEVRATLSYVSRGGLKLEAALDHFKLNPSEAICLDVGASTGGFSDCLLQRGARKIYAVDVGHGQLHYRLQKDERVINLERTHIRNLTETYVREPADVLTIDVSFISLTTVLPLAWPFLREGGWAVALIKPQFEAGPKNIRKGVVRDPVVRQACVDKVMTYASTLKGGHTLGVIESPIHGPKGNIEFLLVLQKHKLDCF